MATSTTETPPPAGMHQISTARNPEHSAALARLFSRIGELTTLPSQATRLMALAEHESVTVQEIVDLVKSDAPTTMRVLRRVNSAFYGLPNKVDDIALAVNLLGIREMRDIALTASMSRVYCGGDTLARSSGFNREELWVYSVAVANASSSIAERGGLVNPNTAYSAGLLHDIGYYLLDQHLQRHFLRFVALVQQAAADSQLSITDLEQQAFSFDHSALGGYVATQWNLADSIRAAIEFHHRSPDYDGEHGATVATVALADCLAADQGWTALGLPGPQVDVELLMAEAGVAHVALAELIGDVAKAIEQAESASASR